MIRAVTAAIVFGKMHFLLIAENEFFHEIEYNTVKQNDKFHGFHVKRDLRAISLVNAFN